MRCRSRYVYIQPGTHDLLIDITQLSMRLSLTKKKNLLKASHSTRGRDVIKWGQIDTKKKKQGIHYEC